jgi:hypothetical protein
MLYWVNTIPYFTGCQGAAWIFRGALKAMHLTLRVAQGVDAGPDR